MQRRTFFRNAFFSAVPVLLPGFDFLKEFEDYHFIKPVKNQKLAKIVSYSDPKCVAQDFSIDRERASDLFKQALLEFTGRQNIKDATISLFPEFHTALRVSIKLNTASSQMPSHPVMAYTIASCLVEAGLKPENIILWERSEETLKNAGYEISNESGKFRTIGTDSEGFGYDESKTEKVSGVPVNLTSILTKHSDYQINLGVLKHHWFTGAAVCLKNHYGSIPLFDKPLATGPVDIARLHFNACDPYIGALNALIEEKVPTVLHVCDGLLGSYNNGPLGPPQWVQNEIMLSQDPVAVDTLALYRIEKKRKEIGLPPLLNKAMFLRTSANMGLGTNNPQNMDIILKTI